MAEVVSMPKLGFDMAEGTLVRWVVQEGENVAKGAVLAEIETDKATVEVESTFEGVVARHLVPEGEVVPVNSPIAVIAAPGETVDYQSLLGESAPTAATGTTETADVKAPQPAEAVPAEAVQVEAPAGTQPPGRVKASPLARRLALDTNVNLSAVKGSGPDGRITKKDIESYIKSGAPALSAPAAAPTVSTPAAPASALPQPTAPAESIRESETIPLNRLRAAIGRRMVESKQQVPHFYLTHEYDMAPVLELRQQVNALLPEDQKTSVNDYILKAAALALREFPNLNASLAGDQILRHGGINIGVAVAVDGGLLTVVCRYTDLKPVQQISSEVKTMAGRARDGKVRPDDIEGSTFSVSNLGMFDIEHFIAIINPPEAAILALGSARQVPVVRDGQIVPGWRMKATLSVDHRVSDGAEGARFLQAMAKYIEEPLRLML